MHRTRTEVPHKHWNAFSVDPGPSPSLAVQTTPTSSHCFSGQIQPARGPGTPRLNKSVGSQSLCCLAVQSPGVSKTSEYLGLNRRAESHHGLQGGGTAVISLVFPPKSSYCIHTSLISLQLGTENTLPPLETVQRTINVSSSTEASLQKSKPFVLI